MNPKMQPNPDSLKAGAHGLAKRLVRGRVSGVLGGWMRA